MPEIEKEFNENTFNEILKDRKVKLLSWSDILKIERKYINTPFLVLF